MPTRTHSPGSPDPTDEQLAADYRARGDQAVLGQLYARYLELLYGLCLKYLRDAGRAEDATMDIYEQLVTKLRKHEVDSAWRRRRRGPVRAATSPVTKKGSRATSPPPATSPC